MKIAIFEVEHFEKDYLISQLSGHELKFYDHALNLEHIEEAAGYDTLVLFVYSEVNELMLAKLPGLKFITTRSMGFNHIDVAACEKRGIAVSYVPAYGERTVAEHTFALILSLSRKIFQAYERTEKGIFDYHGLMGFDLQGKTLGIIGGGRIGQNVAQIARGFQMNVLVYDSMPKPELAEKIGFTYLPLDELLSKSDIVSVHVPYMEATHHLLNEAKFKLFKKGAFLINTARGAIIDTKALLQALENKTLLGAGLDVLEDECTIKEERELMSKLLPEKCNWETLARNHMLIDRDDVIITPHIAFNSREAVERILQTTVENINGFVSDQPTNLVPK